jgi:hypothetical protein
MLSVPRYCNQDKSRLRIFGQSDQAYYIFSSQRKFRILVEGEMSKSREMQVGIPQSSFLSATLCGMYINDPPPQTPGVYLALFAVDTFVYATDHKECFVLRKLQRGLN